MWNQDTSTILQVLVSIQSLILVPEPYFNGKSFSFFFFFLKLKVFVVFKKKILEPGYEKSRGTPEGRESSVAYNEVIRVATIQHAMISHLQNPPLGFEKVVKYHFFLKKQELLTQCEQWLEEAKPHKSHHERLLAQVNQLKIELENLKDPDEESEKMDEGKEEQK